MIRAAGPGVFLLLSLPLSGAALDASARYRADRLARTYPVPG